MKFKVFSALFFCAICFPALSGCRPAVNNNSTVSGISVADAEGKIVTIGNNSRIVSVGTATTETIYALGAGEKLVGVDNSSREYLPESKNLPTVGARTVLNAEGILSFKPTLVIMNADSGPPQIIEQLRNSGVTVLTLTPDYTVETVKAKVSTIAKALALDGKATEINKSIDNVLITMFILI